MAGVCIEKLPHSCGSMSALQVFQDDDGSYNGYCFACNTVVKDPYENRPKGYKPISIRKSKEEIEKELDEISSFKSRSLPTRKLSAATLSVYGVKVGVSEVDGETPVTHYYPYYKDGQLKAYKVRLVENKKMWSIGDQSDVDLFGWDVAIGSASKKCFVTEGEIDAMSLYQIMKDHVKGTKYEDMEPAVVSLPHGAGSAVKDMVKNIKKLKEFFKEIVLVFDEDNAGRKAAEDVVRVIPDISVAKLPDKDVNDCLVNGRSKAAYTACVFNAKA